MRVYKLTDESMRTHNGFQWEIWKWYETSGEGKLCGPGWLHGYEHPLLAVLHNPIHVNFYKPRLFETWTGNGKIKKDGQMKLGSTKMKLVKEIPFPKITTTQRIAYGILCALEVYDEPEFQKWAENWLNGEDRTARAAVGATMAARAAEAWAAMAATMAAGKINLIRIAQKAMKY